MITKIFKSTLLVAATLALLSFDLPKGWYKAGSDPDKYEMGIDKGSGQDGKNAATIKSAYPTIKGFGTLMQNCKPTKFAGKRVRMTGMLKCKDVENYAGLWLRVDELNTQIPLYLDNMSDRPVKGTTDWQRYEIVADVPEYASNMAYGALLQGTGQIWFDSLNFEIVDKSVLTTGKKMELTEKPPVSAVPENLNFDD